MTESVVKDMVDMIQADERVAYTYGIVGSGGGEEVYKASINMELIDRGSRPAASVVMKQLRGKPLSSAMST